MTLIAAFTALCVLVAGAAFAAGRWFDDSGGPAVRAVQEPTPSSTNRAIVTIDGYTIDTSDPAWMDPFREAEAKRPRYDRNVNGIAVGPTVPVRTPARCATAELLTVDQAVNNPRLGMNPNYLPPFAEAGTSEADGCIDDARSLFRHYSIPADQEGAERIVRQEDNWFDVRHGSVFHLIRRIQTEPALRVAHIAAERWEEATIAGKPAAIARPIIGSLGPAMVLVWDAGAGVLTQVSGDNISIDELIKISEGLQ